MSPAYVRLCPVCEAHNPADAPLCACGASLAGVDFTLEPEPTPDPVADGATMTLATAQTVICPHDDCRQPNPAENDRCLYCNRPLRARARLTAMLRWPWGETTTLGERLTIGREAPTPEPLITRLERDYGNVSRRHAEFRFNGGELTLTDLGSLNGTFVDAHPLPPGQAARLGNGQRVRFGGDLTVEILLAETDAPDEQSHPA